MTRHDPRRAGKGPVMIVVLLVVLAAAAFFGFRYYSQRSAEDAALKKYDEASMWKQNLSRYFARDESRKFQRVQLAVNRDESDAADHSIELSGIVNSQADLDELTAMLKKPEFTPPVRSSVSIKVQPTAVPDPAAAPSAPPAPPADAPKPAAPGAG
jgi:Tfp pilus assembly protein PilE